MSAILDALISTPNRDAAPVPTPAPRSVARPVTRPTLLPSLALLATLLGSPAILWAGEADDLQAMIDRARNGVTDLERLDERGAAREDATVLRLWLEEAWRLRSEQKYDEVRIVLDRCDAQAEMIRQKIQASKLTAQANEREESLKRLRENIEKNRRAIQQAQIQKAALEARSK